MSEKEWYRERIEELLRKVDKERFLRAIYISVRNYVEEQQGGGDMQCQREKSR